MIDALCILKSVVPAYLFKSADVMQHTDQPGKINVLTGQPEAHRNALTKLCHLIGVDDL